MSRWKGFAGILGAVIFLFGIFAGLIIQSFGEPLVLIHLGLGVLLLIVWLLSSGVRSLGLAGEVMRGRGVRFGANAILYTAVFAGLLVAANWFAHRYNKRLDLTEAGVYSLTSQSVQVLERLQKPLTLVGFAAGDPGEEIRGREILDLYRHHNPGRVKTEFVDPRAKPHLVDRYEMKPGNLLYIEYGEGAEKGVSRLNEITEEAITNAVIKLTRGEAKKIYYVEGHGEPGLEDGSERGLKLFAGAVQDEHLTVQGIILARQPVVPADAAAVFLVSPKKPLLPEEKETLVNYVNQGGRLFLFHDPRTTGDVTELAAKFGIEIGEDVIIDQIQRLFAGPALGAQPMVMTYGAHPITNSMSEQHVSVYNVASSVKKGTTGSGEGNYVELASTSPTAWAEKSLDRVFDADEPMAVFEPGDLAGPVPLAVAWEKPIAPAGEEASEGSTEEPKFEQMARVVVFGDSDWVLNSNLQVYANRDLALNVVNWLVGEEGGISVRPKSMRASLAPIDRSSFLLILALSFLIPELILLAGLVIWWGRRTVPA